MRFEFRVLLLVIVAGACGLGVYAFLPPVAQDPAYHHFADGRTFYGVPNFFNVAGNAAFLIAGLWGMVEALRRRAGVLWVLFFLGVFAAGFGSAYYHLAPDNARLAVDRLPMAVAFMALFSILVRERIHARAGAILAPLFLYLGVYSVGYWIMTESMGRGDLRPYGLVQFLPMVLVPLMLLLFPARHGGTKYLLHAFVWYAAAKAFENGDDAVFRAAQGLVSGHTLKHIAAAAGSAWVIGYMRAVVKAPVSGGPS